MTCVDDLSDAVLEAVLLRLHPRELDPDSQQRVSPLAVCSTLCVSESAGEVHTELLAEQMQWAKLSADRRIGLQAEPRQGLQSQVPDVCGCSLQHPYRIGAQPHP